MCGVFMDATFHGGSNDTIGRHPTSDIRNPTSTAGDFADFCSRFDPVQLRAIARFASILQSFGLSWFALLR
jgi:hypothetical protein